MMHQLQAGFGRVNITPMLGIPMAGYFKDRYAEGVLDELEINALALACGQTRVVLMAIDHCGIKKEILDPIRHHISEVTGIPYEGIYIHATHTHTGPMMEPGSDNALIREYIRFVDRKASDAAQLALADLKPAKMGYAVGEAPDIAFVRRFRMKDGSIRTNPGVNNPEILEPIGDVDQRVNVLRFDQEGGRNLVLVNFGDHPDTVGGSKISGDWPAFTRRIFEKAVDDTRCIFFNGAQGDVNHVKVFPKPGDLNDMFMDFDDVSRGYGHARHMGNVVAGAVMQVYDKVAYTDVESIRFVQKTMLVPSNVPDPRDMPEAHRIHELHIAGKDDEIPYKGMMLTTVVAEAGRMVRLEHGPDAFPMYLAGIAIGNVVLCGIPGEPFTGVGRGIKQAPGWDLILPTCNTNAKEGYFPMRDSYEEGGYEARGSNFKAGVAEFIIEQATKMLGELRA